MKAIVVSRYGSPDVLELEDVEMPDVADDVALVRVRAASINPADWFTSRLFSTPSQDGSVRRKASGSWWVPQLKAT